MENDLIRRSDALNCSHIVYIEYLETDDGGYIEGDADCIPVVKKRDIESIPAVDAVEVVRCGQCEHRKTFEDVFGNYIVCVKWKCFIADDDYCSWGQRREDGDA